MDDKNKQAEPVANHSRVCLSGAQLLEALDFIAPDRDTDREQLESDVTIQYGGGHDGTGYYCWVSDYPEEGAILLDGEGASSILAAPAPTQSTQEPVGWKLVPVHPTPEMRAAGAKINGQGWDFAHHTWNTMLLNAPNYVDLAAPAPASPAQSASAQQALESLCQWLLHRFGPDSPEGNEASSRLAAPAPTASPAALTLDANEVEFLAARLRRLLNHFKYPLPDWAKDDKHLIGIAPTCIGAVLANLSKAEEAELAQGVLDDLARKGLAASPADQVEDARDAARYRWLRSDDLGGAWESGMPYVAADHEDRSGPIVLVGDECDAAVDAAMSASKEGA